MSSSRIERKALDQIRFILIVMVVFIHAPGWGAFWYGQSLAALPVPGFFLVSGYLFFRGFEEVWDWRVYAHKMRRRAIRLLIPYLLCNLLKLLSLPLAGSEPVHGFMPFLRAFWDIDPTFCAPVLLATWFLRDLFLMFLLAPLLWLLVHWGRLAPFLLLALCDIQGWWPAPHVLSLEGLAFFSLGAAFTLCRISFLPLLARRHIWAYAAGIASLVLYVFLRGEAIRYLFLCGGLWALFVLVYRLCHRPDWGFSSQCTDAVLFVYLGHALFVLNAVYRSLDHLVPTSSLVCSILLYFTAPLLTVALLVFARTYIYLPLRNSVIRLFGRGRKNSE